MFILSPKRNIHISPNALHLPEHIINLLKSIGVIFIGMSLSLKRDYKGTGAGCAYRIDDYRNPICAAIGLAFHFGVTKTSSYVL